MNFSPPKNEPTKLEGLPTYESVTKYMATNLITFHPEQLITEVIDKMLEYKISGAPVVNDHGSLVGVISEKDCLKVMLAAAYHNRPMNTGIVKNYMSTKITTISDEKDVLDVANEFLKTNFRRYPVVNAEGKLVGQVSRRDILRAAQHMESTTWNKK